jgi:PAS domain-containing protein
VNAVQARGANMLLGKALGNFFAKVVGASVYTGFGLIAVLFVADLVATDTNRSLWVTLFIAVLLMMIWRLLSLQQAADDLRENQRRLLTVLPVGVLTTDLETQEIVEANPAVIRLLKSTAEELIGHRLPSGCGVERGITGIEHVQQTLRRADGSAIPVLYSRTRARISGRKFLVESFLDISDNGRSSEKLARYSPPRGQVNDQLF